MDQKKKKAVVTAGAWYGKEITVLEDSGLEVKFLSDRGEDPFLAEMRTAHAFIPGLMRVTRELMQNSPDLVIVAAHGVGYNNVDIEAADDLGVLVTNLPGVNSDAVAEFTFGLMLGLTRHISQSLEEMRKGGWRRPELLGGELRGKTLSIIGLGRIGSRVCKLGNAFGMRVLAHDPYISDESFREAGANPVSKEEAISEADLLTLHVPLTIETRNWMGAREFAGMKNTALLINTARGGVVNEPELVRALDRGLIAGAGIDVFEEEPPRDRALVVHPRVICTPHLAGLSNEARYRMSTGSSERVVCALKGEKPPDVVNHPRNPRYLKLA